MTVRKICRRQFYIFKAVPKFRKPFLHFSSGVFLFHTLKMALNIVKYPLTRMTKRAFATQAAANPCDAETPPPDVTCTVLPNRLMVSTLDLNGPLSRVSVAFRVGSRHETPKNLGIVHVIRSLAGFGTKNCTGFSIWKNTQHNGINLYCTGDREVTGFHLVGARHKISCTLKYLAAIVAAPAFKLWEVNDNKHRLMYEIKGLSPQARVIDNLHLAAFRNGLGNSLFIAEDRIGEHNPAMLENFYKEGFTANRAAVTGYNVLHNEMLEFSKSLELHSNELPDNNGKFFGGEVRQNVNSYFAHVAIAGEGVGTKDIKETLTYCVLQHAYGISPVIAWGGSPSPLYKAVYSTAPDAGVSSLNVSYTDSGLFGFMITGPASSASKAVTEALKVIKSGTVSEKDFARGKALVKANVLYSSENTENLIEDMCYQSLQGGVIIPGLVIAEAVEKISYSDVCNAAKKVASGKFALSAYGDLSNMPYLVDIQ